MTKAIDLCQAMNQGLSSLRLSPEARQQVRSRAYGRARNRPKAYRFTAQERLQNLRLMGMSKTNCSFRRNCMRNFQNLVFLNKEI